MMDKRKLHELTKKYFKQGWKSDKYIDGLLPYELEHMRKNCRIKVDETDILVQLVGDSWDPLFISMCVYKPKKLILVLNQRYGDETGSARGNEYCDYIDKLKDRELIDVIPEGVHQDSKKWEMVEDEPVAVFRFLKNNVLPLMNDDKRIVIDITGSKKSMASGAYLFASYTDCPVSYVDFDRYCSKFRRAYGYTCKVNELENPMNLFMLREWERVQQLYNKYAFQSAIELIEDIRNTTKDLFEEEDIKAMVRLEKCLEFYSLWDNGDFIGANEMLDSLKETLNCRAAYTKFTVSCPAVVKELGKKDVWVDKQKNVLCEIKKIEGEKNIKDSMYLKDKILLLYAHDELFKITRLIDCHEDYRSALLRAVSLNEMLLRTRFVRLWIDNRICVKMGNKQKYTRDELIKHLSFSEEIVGYDNKILDASNSSSIIGAFRKETPKNRSVNVRNFGRAYFPPKEELDKEKGKLEEIWHGVSLKGYDMPDDIFKIRNKAIHFCLSVTRDIAEAAACLAQKNLRNFQDKWTQETVEDGKYQAIDWYVLCNICGIKFLPRRRG